MVIGVILFLLIGLTTGGWGPAAIGGVIVSAVVFMFREDAKDARAYYNRRDYWAKGGPNQRGRR